MSTILLPNFANELKELKIFNVQMIENDFIDFIFPIIELAENNELNIQYGPTRLELLENDYVTDNDKIFLDFNNYLNENIFNNEDNIIELELENNEKKRNLILYNIPKLLSDIYKLFIGNIHKFVMVNYNMFSYLNNDGNSYNKIRKFKTNYNYIINEYLSDNEIIIGFNSDEFSPFNYIFKKDLTKSLLYFVPDTNTFLKKIKIN